MELSKPRTIEEDLPIAWARGLTHRSGQRTSAISQVTTLGSCRTKDFRGHPYAIIKLAEVYGSHQCWGCPKCRNHPNADLLQCI